MAKLNRENRNKRAEQQLAEAKAILEQCGTDQASWDRELDNTIEVSRRETLLDKPEELENSLVEYKDVLEEPTEKIINQGSVWLARELLLKLTIRERKVIQGLFWEEKSERDVAANLKVSRATVRHYRERALKKMGEAAMAKALAIKSFDDLAS